MTNEEYTSPDTPSSKRDRVAPGPEFAPGVQVGPFRIEAAIAAGGCGAVYSARDRTGGLIALKILHRAFASSAEMVARFAREAQVVDRLRHPAIVEMREIGELPDGRPFLAMELLGGTTLRRLIDRRGRLPVAEALLYLAPICEALTAAHALGVVHRDLKPSNVAVVEEGASPRVKLLDFGIAKLVELPPGERDLTLRGQRLGTPHAMSPEQVRGDRVDARTDVYALGVLSYFVLTGRFPFDSPDPLELERMHLGAPPPRPSQSAPVSPEVDAVVLRCLEKSADLRFDSAAAFCAALRRAASPKGAAHTTATAQAAALFVEVRCGEDDDDGLLGALALVLDELEELLQGAGFSLPLQLSTALLAVQLLPDEPQARAQALQAVSQTARMLVALPARSGWEPRLSLRVQVHVDSAELRAGGAGSTLHGPIVELGGWAHDSPALLRLTPQAEAALAAAPRGVA